MREVKTPKQKEIERHEYIIKKLKKRDFLCMPEPYKQDTDLHIAWHEKELQKIKHEH